MTLDYRTAHLAIEERDMNRDHATQIADLGLDTPPDGWTYNVWGDLVPDGDPF